MSEEITTMDVVPIDRSQVLRCPFCRTPYATGELGNQTAIEVKCRRCKRAFQTAVIA